MIVRPRQRSPPQPQKDREAVLHYIYTTRPKCQSAIFQTHFLAPPLNGLFFYYRVGRGNPGQRGKTGQIVKVSLLQD